MVYTQHFNLSWIQEGWFTLNTLIYPGYRRVGLHSVFHIFPGYRRVCLHSVFYLSSDKGGLVYTPHFNLSWIQVGWFTLYTLIYPGYRWVGLHSTLKSILDTGGLVYTSSFIFLLDTGGLVYNLHFNLSWIQEGWFTLYTLIYPGYRRVSLHSTL